MLKEYLQLGRAHTAPVEMFGLPLAAYIGGVSPIYLPIFAVLGWFVHNAGFGMNSLIDYLYGYDKNDPYKQHHPLVRGSIGVLGASIYIFGLQLLSVFYFFLLNPAVTSSILFAGYVIFGWAYNILAKKNKVAGMFELGASMGLLFFSITNIHGLVSSIAAFGSLYITATTMYQIGVLGDLKDIAAKTGEKNLLRDLGSYVDDNNQLHTSLKTVIFSHTISVIKAVMLGLTAYFINPYWSIPVIILALATFLYYSKTLLKEGNYEHSWRLKIEGMGEVWGYIIFVITLFPLFLSWWVYAFIFFFVLPPLYFYAMNKYMWSEKSGWAPGV